SVGHRPLEPASTDSWQSRHLSHRQNLLRKTAFAGTVTADWQPLVVWLDWPWIPWRGAQWIHRQALGHKRIAPFARPDGHRTRTCVHTLAHFPGRDSFASVLRSPQSRPKA